MKYQLLQIHLTDAEVDKINAEGHDAVDKHKMKLDMSIGMKKKIAPIAKKALELGYYTHVSNIIADDLYAEDSSTNLPYKKEIFIKLFKKATGGMFLFQGKLYR